MENNSSKDESIGTSEQNIDQRTGIPDESCFVGEFLAVMLVVSVIVAIIILDRFLF